MKIIDLLNKIANGEEVPQKIKIGNKIYNYETFNIGKGDNYFTAEWEEVKGYRINYDGTYYYLEIRDYNLNDEVEILEEKEICHKCGKYNAEYNQTYCEFCLGISKLEEEKKIPEKIYYAGDDVEKKIIVDKIDEIIDYLIINGENNES